MAVAKSAGAISSSGVGPCIGKSVWRGGGKRVAEIWGGDADVGEVSMLALGGIVGGLLALGWCG